VSNWSDVLARVAGLKSRLLSGEQLRTLARSPDLPALAEGMERAGFPVRATVLGISPAALDLAVRRQAGGALRQLLATAGHQLIGLSLRLLQLILHLRGSIPFQGCYQLVHGHGRLIRPAT